MDKKRFIERTTIYLPGDVSAEVARIAEHEGDTKAAYIRRIVTAAVRARLQQRETREAKLRGIRE